MAQCKNCKFAQKYFDRKGYILCGWKPTEGDLPVALTSLGIDEKEDHSCSQFVPRDSVETIKRIVQSDLQSRIDTLEARLKEVGENVQGMVEDAVRNRDECDKYNARWYMMDGRKEALIGVKKFLHSIATRKE